MSDEKNKGIKEELFEFLVKFEGAIKPIQPGTDAASADIWNELHVPVFRNFKVFMHQAGDEMIIVIPTHMSGAADVHYHVIRERMSKDDHNGEYEILSMAAFRARYKCNFIQQPVTQLQSAKITDLAKEFVTNLPEIKKLKRKTPEEQYESVMFFSRIILDFLMSRNLGPEEKG